MCSKKYFRACCVYLIFCFPSWTFADNFQCPLGISTSQSLNDIPKSWSLVTGDSANPSTGLRLSGVHFYVGTATSHHIELAPLKENPAGLEIWKFGKPEKEESIFQVCEYFGTVIKIERALEARIKACYVKHPGFIAQSRENSPEPYIKDISCK